MKIDMKREMVCLDCGSSAATELSVQLTRNGRAMLRVDCLNCGTNSHFLPYSPINEAVAVFGRLQAHFARQQTSKCDKGNGRAT